MLLVSKRSLALVAVAAVLVDLFLWYGSLTETFWWRQFMFLVLLCIWTVSAGWVLLQFVPYRPERIVMRHLAWLPVARDEDPEEV
jgi:hypothetical protein